MRMSELLNEVNRFELDEGFSPREIKMAIGIASDPRYAKGNMTGAVNAIEKMKKGLSKHPQVAAVLKRQNEGFASDAQRRAAFASGYKEKDKKEGNAFGMALKSAKDKGEKTFVVSGKKYNVEDYDVKEEITEKFSDGMIDKLRKAYEPLKGKKIPPAPLMKIFDKIDSNKAGLIQLYKADIPFVSMMAMSRLMLKHDMKADEINKLGKIRREDFVEEVELDEAKYDYFDTKDAAQAHAKKHGGKVYTNTGKGATKVKGVPKNQYVVIKGKMFEEVDLDEKKLGYALVVQQKDGSREIVAKGSKNDMRSAAKKHGGLKQGKVFTTLTAKEVGDKVIGIGEEVNEKFTKKDFKDNEDSNHHTENGVEIVNMFGTSAEKVKMAGIAARHNMKGISRKDQQDRDALVKKYYSKLESVNEMSYKPGSFKDTKPQEKAAKALADLAKTGGMDKKDFEKARALYVQASDPTSREKLKKFIFNLDTEPKEEIMDKIGRNDPKTFLQMYPDATEGEPLTRTAFKHRSMKSEEVELGEAFKPDQVKAAISIARDNRFSMKGMVDKKTAIEKIAKGLSKDPAVKKVLDKMYEEFKLDEAMSPFGKVLKKNKKLIDNDYDGLHRNYKAYVMIDDEDLGDLGTTDSERIFISLKKNKGVAYPEGDITAFFKNEKDAEQFVKDMGGRGSKYGRLDINLTPLGRGIKQESIDEKYDLYHKDFSSAMQHAYSYAKQKLGITIDPKEIDSKVATGPKKPTEGKTNKYRLKGKGGNVQIQVYNKGGSKPFELNMYKEENDLISLASKHISHMQMAEKIDPADVDDDASEKDIENAAKNIIMQLRKSVSMRGNKDVEFASGKQKVDMRIAQKAISMHMKMKPQDKLSFQNTIAKSYKDLLNAVKGK